MRTLLAFGLWLLGIGLADAQRHVRLLEADMDITHGIVATDKIGDSPILPQAFSGEGVVLGVTDIGFDFNHPNFSATKFRRFWDMLSRDTLNTTLNIGRDYEGEGEIRKMRRSYDAEEQTHGTHVLGIAAGGNERYRGIAPDADVVVINNVLSNNVEMADSAQVARLEDTYELDEFEYIFKYAEEMGQPCVINISAGRRQSFGDGFTECNERVKRMCGPGRIIVASAGNNGQQQTYLHKPTGKASAGSELVVNATGSYLFMQTDSNPALVFYLSPDKGVTKYRYETRPTESIQAEDSLRVYDFEYQGKHFQVRVKAEPSDYDGRNTYYITLSDSLKQKLGYPRIYICIEDNEGENHLFTQGAQFYNREDGFADATCEYSVNFPACYDDIICVGATTHRNEVTNIHGEANMWDNGEIGHNYLATSVGPRLDGMQKPDVVAPGSFIVSSYSSFYKSAHPEASDMKGEVMTTEIDGVGYPWVCNSGTSMSSPVVAGIIALWLQANPRLTPQEIKDIIARTARHPDESLPYPNAIYGYGEIDAYAGLLDILGLDKIEEISGHQPQGIAFNVDGKRLELRFSSAGVSADIVIFDTAGRAIERRHIGSADSSEYIDLQHLKAGIYAVQVNSPDKRSKGSTLIRL